MFAQRFSFKRISGTIAACFLVLSSSAALAQETVKIGCVLPLTGGSAAIGAQTRVGVQAAVDVINANGGIQSMNGAKLQAIFADSQSKADVGVSETERLIQRENVPVMCGAFNSAVTHPATEIAERNKTPWIVVGSVKDEITERGFKYIFRINNKATYDANEQIEAMKLLASETGNSVKRLAMLYEGGDWGRSHAENIRQLAKENGMELVFDEALPAHQVDLTSQLLKIRGSRADALILALYTADQLLFTRQFTQQKLDLPYGLHSVGGGTEDPSFYAAVDPQDVAYYFVQEDWQVDMLQVNDDPLLHQLNDVTKKELGYDMSAYVAQGVTSVYVIKDALERAGSADREKLRDALAETDITEGPSLFTGYQRIKFDEHGQNTFAHGVISQNLDGERRAIWPLENRGEGVTPAWPVPKWSER